MTLMLHRDVFELSVTKESQAHNCRPKIAYLLIGVSVFLLFISIYVVQFFSSPTEALPKTGSSGKVMVATHESYIVSSLVSGDRSELYTAFCDYDLATSHGFEPLEYELSNLNLLVTKRMVSKPGDKVLFSKHYTKRWMGSSKAQAPLWGAGYVNTADPLPTMKLTFDGKGGLLAILIDPAKILLYKPDASGEALLPINSINDDLQKTLIKWYQEAFDPGDGYCCEGLLVHASFFNPALRNANPEVELKGMYDEWRKLIRH